MEAFVQSTIDRQVGIIEFYHPQSNSLPGQQLRELTAAIEAFGKTPEVRVILLKSAGNRAFCAGASFDELISIKDRETGRAFFSGFASVINAIRKAPKFVIVRVQGKAVGGGVGLAAAGDYTIGTAHAAIKLSELAIGIGPFVVGPAVIRKIGVSAFSQLSIHATEFQGAEWAREKGLYASVHESTDDMDAAIEALTQQLVLSSPDAMKALKKAAWVGTEDWDELLAARAEISGELVLSSFTREAINRFKSGS
ncbi:MAG TPA: enoyl-CoA hydratase/isomerase family protein [Sphingobacteriaceae bacterium]|nr:enoyl-CoA hydratase/isomerase family protein [Sphingobacteriaceae bacterium]